MLSSVCWASERNVISAVSRLRCMLPEGSHDPSVSVKAALVRVQHMIALIR